MIRKVVFTGYSIGCLLGTLLFVSCNGLFMDSQKSNTPKNNFDLLWQIFDERYCFFEEKQIDWDGVYEEYYGVLQQRTDNKTHSEYQLFDLMSVMLLKLCDGHVVISNGTESRTYTGWFSRYPENYDDALAGRYFNKSTESLNNGLSFTWLPGEIGYIRCSSFSDNINRNKLDDVLARFASNKGVIIDVRGNGGGLVSEAYTLASHFVPEKTCVGYIRYKTGKGHGDFSEYFRRYVEPGGATPFSGKVAILTNRRVYSAANLFVSVMKDLPQVCVIGAATGGGGGMPISAELYNGWTVELSTNPMFDINKKSIESGIEPHRSVMLETRSKTSDNIIERAKEWILEESGSKSGGGV